MSDARRLLRQAALAFAAQELLNDAEVSDIGGNKETDDAHLRAVALVFAQEVQNAAVEHINKLQTVLRLK